MMELPAFSAAAIRNSEPILGVLRTEFAQCRSVFEIGSGTAQHAVYFSSALPELEWQTSDLADHHELIRARLLEAGLPNVREPLLVDMESPPAIEPAYDAAYSSNTMHIMSMAAVRNLLPFVSGVLRPGGLFCYYGAFRRDQAYSTQSNAEFDRSLRARQSGMGLRDLEVVDSLASNAGLLRDRLYAMPANNLLIVWSKQLRSDVSGLSD